MQRKKRLRADPEKVREFMRRGRGSLKRETKLERSGSLKRTRAKRGVAGGEGPLTPTEWRRQVYELSGRKCIVQGTPSATPYDPDFHAHHFLPAQQLRKRGLLAYVWDARNGGLVTEAVHMRHEHSEPTILREHVPARVWEFCAEIDALGGTEWATAKVERLHPTNPRRN